MHLLLLIKELEVFLNRVDLGLVRAEQHFLFFFSECKGLRVVIEEFSSQPPFKCNTGFQLSFWQREMGLGPTNANSFLSSLMLLQSSDSGTLSFKPVNKYVRFITFFFF